MNYTQITQNMSNVNSLGDILNLANTVTGDIFWTGIYWMLIVIVLIVTLGFGFEVSMLMSFFFALIVGIFLLYLGLIHVVTLGITTAVLLFITIYLVYTSNKAQ